MRIIAAAGLALVLLSGCAWIGIQRERDNAEILRTAGFTADEAEWMGADLDNRDKKISYREARKIKLEIYENGPVLDKLRGWIMYEFSPEESGRWSEKNFSPAEADNWRTAGYSPDRARPEADRQLQKAREEENKRYLVEVEKFRKLGYDLENEKTRDDLIHSNPYSIKGQSFYLNRRCEGTQLLDRYSGRYIIGNIDYSPVIAILLFKPHDAIPEHTFFTCRAVGTGAVQYQSLAGIQTVPVLKVVSVVLDQNGETFYIPDSEK